MNNNSLLEVAIGWNRILRLVPRSPLLTGVVLAALLAAVPSTTFDMKSPSFTSALVLSAPLVWGLQPSAPRTATRLFATRRVARTSPLLRLAGSDETLAHSPKGKTILESIDDLGLSLKPRAARASFKISTSGGTEKVGHFVKMVACYSLFLLYRAYRGFFVILPAVFRDVYRKLESSVEDPFVDDTAAAESSRWRTRITVSVLSFILTASYVITGAIGVVFKFFRTVASTSSIATSFEAAVEERQGNEDKILRSSQRINGTGGQRP